MATATPEMTGNAACCTSPLLKTLSIGELTTAEIVRQGLGQSPKQLPPWLFYDEAGSLLFEQITSLPEYYLTRTERALFGAHAGEMITAAADGRRLRILELGAGSADKTRTLLAAALNHQGSVEYTPIDVSETALEAAQARLEEELPQVAVRAQVGDYTQGLELEPCSNGERRLILSIGSSIGNFCTADAVDLLKSLSASLQSGDALLVGLDLAPAPNGKTVEALIEAYDDAQGVTAAFNKNMLVRLNRELDCNFDLDAFNHQIRWNETESRIEMHLQSLKAQTVRAGVLGQDFYFAQGETIHTENSCKYRSGELERMLKASGFKTTHCWTDPNRWFAVYLATVI